MLLTSVLKNVKRSVIPNTEKELCNSNTFITNVALNTSRINKNADDITHEMYSDHCVQGLARSEKLFTTEHCY